MAEYVVGAVLTAADPKPEGGTQVRDDLGRVWQIEDEEDAAGWPRALFRPDVADDPESWAKVAGNYGPVTVVRVGYGDG